MVSGLRRLTMVVSRTISVAIFVLRTVIKFRRYSARILFQKKLPQKVKEVLS